MRTLAASIPDAERAPGRPTVAARPSPATVHYEKPVVGYPTTYTEPLLGNVQRCWVNAEKLLGEPLELLGSAAQQNRTHCWALLGTGLSESVV